MRRVIDIASGPTRREKHAWMYRAGPGSGAGVGNEGIERDPQAGHVAHRWAVAYRRSLSVCHIALLVIRDKQPKPFPNLQQFKKSILNALNSKQDASA